MEERRSGLTAGMHFFQSSSCEIVTWQIRNAIQLLQETKSVENGED